MDRLLNRSLAGVETKYLIFGGSIVGGCFALIACRVITWEQAAPLVGVVVGHYFGRRSSGNDNGGNNAASH